MGRWQLEREKGEDLLNKNRDVQNWMEITPGQTPRNFCCSLRNKANDTKKQK